MSAPTARDLADSLVPENVEPAFIASRYPFTYAYDFVRSHSFEFVTASGVDAQTMLGDLDGFGWSRADTAGIVRRYAEATDQFREQVLVAFADAYLRENEMNPSSTETHRALMAARRESWKSLGYVACPVD